MVQNVAETLRGCFERNRLAVLVAVHFDDCVEFFFKREAVGREADDGEDEVRVSVVVGGGGPDFEVLGHEARVDVVAAGAARVAGHDAEVGAGDAEGGAAIVCVAEVERVVSLGRVGRGRWG